MKVFKFGGGVVQDATSIIQLAQIVERESPDVLVVSAMGKTTCALEEVLQQRIDELPYQDTLQTIYDLHRHIIDQLLTQSPRAAHQALEALQTKLELALARPYVPALYGRLYSEVVAWGELAASTVIYHYLCKRQVPCYWVDARDCIHTRDGFMYASVDWSVTQAAIRRDIGERCQAGGLALTQGFIGSQDGITSTLGKEGSDFTAAIIAASVGASSVTFWKDVPGVMNADPKHLPQATLLEMLSYDDMATMTRYGAKVIHPKALQPLAQHRIPMHVRPFHYPQALGTTITHHAPPMDKPVYMLQEGQCLLDIRPAEDAPFGEAHIQEVLTILRQHHIPVHLLQRDVYSLSVCIPPPGDLLTTLLYDLNEQYSTTYKAPVYLFTALHTAETVFPHWFKQTHVLVAQMSHGMYQAVLEGHCSGSK